jgi:excisionase family DNA binding protein
MTIIEAAKKLGCSTTTVYKYVKSGQIKSTTQHYPANKIEITQEDLDAFAKLSENLLTKEEVATLKGVSVRTVEAWVLKGKLKPVLTFMKRNYFSPEDV